MEYQNPLIQEYLHNVAVITPEFSRSAKTSHLITTSNNLQRAIKTTTEIVDKYELRKYRKFLDTLEGKGWTEFLIFTLDHNHLLLKIIQDEIDRRVKSN